MIHVADGAAQEREKYREIWTFPEYRAYSPGEENVARFMEIMQPRHGAFLIDIGCGRGGAGLAFRDKGLNVSWLDITGDALMDEVDRGQFIEAPLWTNWKRSPAWDYGFCCDVLEHIPPEYTMLCVERILSSCTLAWLQISLVPDRSGVLIDQPLHLTVQPYSWWLVRLASLGTVHEARDLCGLGLFVVGRK